MAARSKPAFPECGRTFDGQTCTRRGEHVCAPRVAHVLAFFAEVLVHTKGRWARQPFVPDAFQRDDILTPLMGTVVWSAEFGRYVRRYRVAWIEIARKNGKSEILAGIVLYLLIADDEEGAEIYGCACDTKQAGKVFEVAERMVRLSPVLAKRLRIFQQTKRIVDERTGSYYELVPGDSQGNLGHNPHGVAFDEVISQRDAGLWNVMRSGMGTREQPLMAAATTAGDDPEGFAAAQHEEMARIAEDPERARHVFAYLRNTPKDADPWDEANWYHANPALGSFLSIQALRDEALEARNDPAKENSFRQFRLNQWVSQSTRWMPLHLWDEVTGPLWPNPTWGRQELAGRVAFAGYDLSSKVDLCSWCLLVPGAAEGEPAELLWRCWLPEEGLAHLDGMHDGKFSRWAHQGWITVTDGAVLDYDKVLADIGEDAKHFRIVATHCDEWSMWPLINRVSEALSLSPDGGMVTAYRNTFDRISPGMTELMNLVRSDAVVHHGNPVARWCFDAVEVRHAAYDPNLIRPVKPQRDRDRHRIDAVTAAAMAVNAWRLTTVVPPRRSVYEDNDLMVV